VSATPADVEEVLYQIGTFAETRRMARSAAGLRDDHAAQRVLSDLVDFLCDFYEIEDEDET